MVVLAAAVTAGAACRPAAAARRAAAAAVAPQSLAARMTCPGVRQLAGLSASDSRRKLARLAAHPMQQLSSSSLGATMQAALRRGRQRHCARLPTSAAAAADGAAPNNQNGQNNEEADEEHEEEEEGEDGEPPELPSEAEMAEAQKVLFDFFKGMGASGDVSRPQDMDLPAGRLTWADAVSLMGISGWRLHGKVCPEIANLVAQIEGCWRAVLPEDQFGLYPLEEKYKYMDSLDPEGKDPFSFRSMQDPAKGEPGYPRLQIENRAYFSRAFRKLHVELAVRQDGLEVFHCVMFPRLQYDLPILSMDVVANNGRVSLAIVDPCPVSANLSLAPFYEQPVRELQARYDLESNRRIPEWGAAIFSPLCVIMRPESSEDLGRFLKYTLALTQMHVQIAKIAHPVGSGGRRRVAGIHAGHQRYCQKQLENDKTMRVLEAAFGAELAQRYMQEVMFDCEPLPAA